MVASFGYRRWTRFEGFQNRSRSEPDVEPHLRPRWAEAGAGGSYRELVDEAGFATLRGLRAEIVGILGEDAVVLVPEADLERPVRPRSVAIGARNINCRNRTGLFSRDSYQIATALLKTLSPDSRSIPKILLQ
jgi:hypothetical protein